jgi:rod shape-determining protein MreC
VKYLATSLIILLLGVIGVLNPVRDFVLAISAPVQFGLYQSAVSIKEFAGFFAGIGDVRNENLKMREEIISLKTQLFEQETIKKENDMLREQLELADQNRLDYKYVQAHVMGNPKDLTSGTIILDKGSRHGIRIGDNVIRGLNLIGIVRSVSFNRAYVEVITSPNMSFTVYNLSAAEGTEALAVGKYGSSISMERILPTEHVGVGDMIATSGKDGLFLPELFVGRVTSVQDDPAQPLKTASLSTLLDFSKLDSVFVIVSEE